MSLIRKYKALSAEEKDNLIIIIAYCLLAVCLFIPFQSHVTYKEHPLYEYDVTITYIYGYEHGLTFINLFIMLLITGTGLSSRSIFAKIVIILLPLVYLPILGAYSVLVRAGWGQPFGNPLESGVRWMLAADLIIIIRSYMAVFRKRV